MAIVEATFRKKEKKEKTVGSNLLKVSMAPSKMSKKQIAGIQYTYKFNTESGSTYFLDSSSTQV
jgi:hypothetical protein